MAKKTVVLKITPKKIELNKIKKAAEIIKKGGIVAFPTETVYGLGANALNAKAVLKIFRAKKRPADNPIIVHVYNKEDIYRLAKHVPKEAEKLISKFWPGPLTLLLKKSKIVPYTTTGGLDTVCIRMPSHAIAQALIKESKTPIAAPSANLAGRPSPTTAEHVLEDLNGKIDAIIDGGRTKVGLESTVLDLTSEVPTVLRPGGVSLEELENVLGAVKLHRVAKAEYEIESAVALSPGMKYRHYAPKAKMILVEGSKEKIIKKTQQLAEEYSDKKVGVLSFSGYEYKVAITKFLGKDLKEAARKLFTTLREFDIENVDMIIAEGCDTKGIGLAIMNRLRKACGYNIIRV
ncbi:MAG: L-threonylcarbamoyladenylate synthase [Candidatus Thermoplasmatota archaeon]|nr:L-threonylcarbamoyladenylate synthase [Candidatus Thermoplasmatota archaeon]